MRGLRILEGARRWRFLALVANGCAQAAVAGAAALCLRSVFDHAVRHWRTAGLEAFAVMGGLYLASGLAGAALRARERVDADLLGFDYTNDLRLRLFDHLAEVPASALERRSEGVVLLRFVGDLTALKLWISHGLAKLTVAAVTSACILGALAVLSPLIAAAAATTLVFGFVLTLALRGPLETAVRTNRKDRGNLSGMMAERIIAMRTVQSLGGARAERERVVRSSDKLRRSVQARATVAGLLSGAAHTTSVVAHLAVLGAGALAVMGGSVTPGAVVASLTLIGPMLPLVNELGHVVELWQSARVCKEKVDQLLAAGPSLGDIEGARPLALAEGRIEFADVSVSGVLNGVDLVAPGGSVVAITGPNGAGKSTLLALILRMAAPADGRVLLDGQDVAAVTRESLRDGIGVVSADLPLLRGSVERNIRYRRPTASAEELARVAALCGVEHLLAPGPDGKPQKLHDRGRNLSLGERQRVLLARALIGSPRILLLDEAEANLDEALSERVATLLESYPGTILLVTRRPSWIAKADRVWKVDAGRVLETVNRTGRAPPPSSANRIQAPVAAD
jgi:ABC-type multidrug transport system fused ATPase/permease subunit